MSTWKLVMNGDPQGFILGLDVFHIFVSNVGSGLLSQFAGNTKMCGAVNMLEGRDVIQRSLDSLEGHVCVNLMNFNKAKCEIQQLSWGNPKHKHSLDSEWIESSLEEKDLGVLVDVELNMTWQCALAAQKANLHQEKPGQQTWGKIARCTCGSDQGPPDTYEEPFAPFLAQAEVSGHEEPSGWRHKMGNVGADSSSPEISFHQPAWACRSAELPQCRHPEVDNKEYTISAFPH
ncbi:hypothetical protein TURU_037527 [Turdus rufiventris]|nr:hypothetical protein TURU_037527 [Turdus rufiventris]